MHLVREGGCICKLLYLLPPICRPEMVVGWYHSHPGFGCWLSGVDINTQQVRGLRWEAWAGWKALGKM